MPNHNVETVKAQLRADIKAAMQARRGDETKTLRALLGAIDNAEAVPVAPTRGYVSHAFGDPAAEVARRVLTAADVDAVIAREIDERQTAADEFERLGRVDRAEMLRAEAVVIARYRAA
jgi:uncharacterized protein YqeY